MSDKITLTADEAPPRKITFTPETRDELKVAYKKAVESGDDTFTFKDNELLTDYAKYLIQYLDLKLSDNLYG